MAGPVVAKQINVGTFNAGSVYGVGANGQLIQAPVANVAPGLYASSTVNLVQTNELLTHTPASVVAGVEKGAHASHPFYHGRMSIGVVAGEVGGGG